MTEHIVSRGSNNLFETRSCNLCEDFVTSGCRRQSHRAGAKLQIHRQINVYDIFEWMVERVEFKKLSELMVYFIVDPEQTTPDTGSGVIQTTDTITA